MEQSFFSLGTALVLTGVVLMVIAWSWSDGQFDELDRASMLPFADEPDPPPFIPDALVSRRSVRKAAEGVAYAWRQERRVRGR